MVVFSKPIWRKFAEKHPRSSIPLNKWYSKAKAADWSDFQEMKQTFNSADYIGDEWYIFDIGGNNYRIAAVVHFKTRTVFIKRVMTHGEYDILSKKGDIKNI